MHVLETSPFPILLVSLVGIVLLTVFGPSLVVGDTWLTLMAGREVVENGLPETETLTVLGQGATWTDQQWLAQVVFYGAHELAGMRAVVVLDVLLVVLALGLTAAAARSGGASSRSTFVVGLLAVLAGPWGWTIRAQTAALPLFAGVLWLLVDAARRGVRRRTLLVLPALVLWANLHGSVVLGAFLTMLLGGYALVRARRLAWLPAALVLLAPLCVLATPYGWDIVAYYELMLVDAPFAEILREWQWSSPSASTFLFYVLATVAVVLVAVPRCRRRLNVFELIVLGVTLLGAVQAVRGVIWFALAAAAILPIALDGLFTRADVAAPKVNRTISVVCARAPCGRARRHRRAAGVVLRLGVARSARSGRSGRRPATQQSGCSPPTAPQTGSSGGSPICAAGSPTTSAGSSTTSRRSMPSCATAAVRATGGGCSTATAWFWSTIARISTHCGHGRPCSTGTRTSPCWH